MAGKKINGLYAPVRASNPKIFVLDTNVILHDHDAIHHFQDNDLYVPVTVIEELDKFKKGNDALAFNARSFVRDIETMSVNGTFESGISLGRGKGHIKIEPSRPFSGENAGILFEDIPDHRIISTALYIKNIHPDRKVILVSKDINMRLKARALGMPAQDYLTDHVEDHRLDRFQKEVVNLKVSDGTLTEMLSGKGCIPAAVLGIKRKSYANQLFRITGEHDGNTVLARYDLQQAAVVRIGAHTASGISPRNEEQAFALEAILNPEIKLISITGPSGSGKTLLALAGALEQTGRYDRIMLSRPIIPIKNQDLGLYPADFSSRNNPYLLPLYDNLKVIGNALGKNSPQVTAIGQMLKDERLLPTPMAFIRGRSLQDTFFIIDESQNLTPGEVKTIITRAGANTKIVFTGDIFQIDQPYLDIHSNGLTHLGEKMQGQGIFEHIHLKKGERSRLSELAGKIL